MSTEISQNIVSSMKSVISSIEYDRQVYRWFLIFISLSAVRQKLIRNDRAKLEYQRLKNTQTAEILSYIVMGLIIIACCLLNQAWPLLWEVLPCTALVRLFKKNRQCVAAVSEQFLLENIKPEELNQQTLYQTCEYLSQQYNTPSLVDIISFQDFSVRKILLSSVLLLPFIFSFKTWTIGALTLAIFLAALAIVNSSFVLKKLK